jgi:beta-glucosidase
MVRGLQGDDPKHMKVAACAKHFAVHSGPEAERHSFDALPSEKDLEETYLPAFRRLVDAGVESVMGAYNRVRGEPACGSNFLLREVLRKRWGFQGHVVSDCGAIDDFHRHHKITRNAAESAALAVRMGCDLNCGCTYNDLLVALKEGLVSEAEIDTSLRRLLATKFKLGMFDAPAHVRYAALPLEIVDSPQHRAIARQAAAQSIVLLKNRDAILPLRRDPSSIMVAGPTAANINTLVGNYAGISNRMVTFVEAIAERLDPNSVLEYRMGCPLSERPPPALNYTYDTAKGMDVVIAIMGLDPTIEGEEGDAVASHSGGDRATIELPLVQREFIRDLRAKAKKLVLVITGGSAVAIPDEHEMADAVLYTWYPGCEGGTALADVLFGEAAPSGKLPITVPRRTEDLPAFNDYRMQGRTYRYAEIEPLYPFGFGLGYAKLSYGPAKVDASQLAANGTVTVQTTLSNGSDSAADEVVQCYVLPPRANADTPIASLVDFKRVTVAAKSSVAVSFKLPASAFAQVDANGQRVHVPGRYRVHVGSASPGARSQALGAPAPALVELSLV